jgi:hypothetical protein
MLRSDQLPLRVCGCRLAGPVSGIVAALTLFVQESPCSTTASQQQHGGVAGFVPLRRHLSLPRVDDVGAPIARLHAVAVGLYFVLGFMTKFVAAGFR